MPQTASRRQAISRIVAIGAALAAAPVQHAAQARQHARDFLLRAEISAPIRPPVIAALPPWAS